MIKKCVGCGAILQDNNPLIEGYTTVLTNDLCKRCFRMKNYGEYEFVTKDNLEYVKILNNIKNKSCLVLYIVDLLAIPKDITKIKEYVGDNEIILILNKIYGLNTNQINYILSNLGINSNLMINNLTPLMLKQINDFITKHYIINNDLQYKTTNNKKLKTLINTYRGFRLANKLPSHGQNTHSNGKTAKK